MRRRTLAAVLLAAGLATGAAAEDPLRGEQYGLDLTGLGAEQAGSVVVTVLDTGVDLEHPDLAGALVPGLDLVDGRWDALVELCERLTHET